MDFDAEQSTEENRKFSIIIRRAGLSERAIWYAGTPADGRDINANKLETLYELINESYGEKAAHSYVRMVACIPYLAPTDFVHALWDLKRNDWDYRGSVSMNGLSAQTEDACFTSYVSILFGNTSVDMTESIRRPFVSNHFSVLQKAAQEGDESCRAILKNSQYTHRRNAIYAGDMYFPM